TPALVPPMAVFLAASWVWLLFPQLVPEALLDACTRAMVELLALLDRLPASPTPLPPRPFGLLLGAAFLSLVALGAPRVAPALGQRVSCAAARAAALLTAILLLPWAAAPEGLQLSALDVGHGTCVVVRAPGAGTWVFDAGSRDRPELARQALLPILSSWEA